MSEGTVNTGAITKEQNIIINRLIICGLIAAGLGLFFVPNSHPVVAVLEVLLRTYILFLCGVMGHEGSHGSLGKTQGQNDFWGQLAFIPLAVPYAPFRITHRFHHAFTNEKDKDPDEYLNVKSPVVFVLRALAMPHHWVVWLVKNNKFTRKVFYEYLMSYSLYAVVYGLLIAELGWKRVLLSMLAAQILNSFLLWYTFAVKTHEGYLIGKAEARSHDYCGEVLYWLTLGLSLHRAHHMHPRKGWLQLREFVRPASLREQLAMKRSIIPETDP